MILDIVTITRSDYMILHQTAEEHVAAAGCLVRADQELSQRSLQQSFAQIRGFANAEVHIAGADMAVAAADRLADTVVVEGKHTEAVVVVVACYCVQQVVSNLRGEQSEVVR